MALTPRFEPGPHWWKASALNIDSSLAPPVLCKLLSPRKWSLLETSQIEAKSESYLRIASSTNH